MTKAEFIARVFAMCGLPSTHARVTSTVIADQADELSLRLSRTTPAPLCLRDEESISLVAGTHTYTATKAWVWLEDLLVSGQPLTRVARRGYARWDPRWDDDPNADAVVYWEVGLSSTGLRKFRLQPTPGTAVANGLTIRGARKPVKFATLLDGDEIVDIPEEYHSGLAWGVVGEVLPWASEVAKPETLQKATAEWAATLERFAEEQDENQQPDSEPVEFVDNFTGAVDSYWENYS